MNMQHQFQSYHRLQLQPPPAHLLGNQKKSKFEKIERKRIPIKNKRKYDQSRYTNNKENINNNNQTNKRQRLQLLNVIIKTSQSTTNMLPKSRNIL